jgi:hypothetical protein
MRAWAAARGRGGGARNTQPSRRRVRLSCARCAQRTHRVCSAVPSSSIAASMSTAAPARRRASGAQQQASGARAQHANEKRERDGACACLRARAPRAPRPPHTAPSRAPAPPPGRRVRVRARVSGQQRGASANGCAVASPRVLVSRRRSASAARRTHRHWRLVRGRARRRHGGVCVARWQLRVCTPWTGGGARGGGGAWSARCSDSATTARRRR